LAETPLFLEAPQSPLLQLSCQRIEPLAFLLLPPLTLFQLKSFLFLASKKSFPSFRSPDPALLLFFFFRPPRCCLTFSQDRFLLVSLRFNSLPSFIRL
jgi:hypothetical protein